MSVSGADVPRSVKNQVVGTHDALESIDCTYTVLRSDDVQPNRAPTLTRHHVLQKGRMRFSENVHSGDKGAFQWDLNHTRQFYTGEVFGVFFVKSRFLETLGGELMEDYPWKVRVDNYITAMGWWPRNDDAPPEDRTITPFKPLRLILDDPSYELVTVPHAEGESRFLFLHKVGVERVCLDKRIGWGIRRRDIYHPVTADHTLTVELSNFEPVSLRPQRTIWFPHQIGLHRPSTNAQPDYSVRMAMENLVVNEVSDSAFDVTLPPGTIKQDRNTGEVTRLPGGLDLLDHTVSHANHLFLHSRGGSDSWSPSAASCIFAGCFTGCILVALHRACRGVAPLELTHYSKSSEAKPGTFHE